MNEWYLEDLSENIRMVFDLKRREGKYIGGFPIYGYQEAPADKNHIIPDPEAAEVVRQKKASYKSKVIIDTPEDQWYRVEGAHEAIIDRITFDAVQRGLKLRTKTGGSGETHLLSGLVKCAD